MKRPQPLPFDLLPGPNLDPGPQEAQKLERIEVA